jgi:hypothetical protein
MRISAIASGFIEFTPGNVKLRESPRQRPRCTPQVRLWVRDQAHEHPADPFPRVDLDLDIDLILDVVVDTLMGDTFSRAS